ncbi:MAG: hypothetical protein JOZ04_13370 [Acidimicrobiia bacterium]|nr:hypothetical protein [Acidimicrobiia bacterium]
MAAVARWGTVGDAVVVAGWLTVVVVTLVEVVVVVADGAGDRRVAR